MNLTQEEKSKMEFVTNFIVGKVGVEKAAKYLSGFRSGRDFLNVLEMISATDTEPLSMPELPVEKGEDNRKPADKDQKQSSDDGTLPLPQMKF